MLGEHSGTRWLKDGMPDGSLGFMPGREAPEAWFALEGMIECSLQDARVLSGYGTDLVKAFPLFQAAEHLGAPSSVLTPWRAFVGNMQRRFLVQGL